MLFIVNIKVKRVLILFIKVFFIKNKKNMTVAIAESFFTIYILFNLHC